MVAAAEAETEEAEEKDEEEAREIEAGDERQAYARWRSALREATNMDILFVHTSTAARQSRLRLQINPICELYFTK